MIKINLDLRNACSTSGIGNFKRNLAIHIARFSDIELRGCYNYTRHLNKKNYDWFEGKLNQSFVLDKLVYNNKNFHLPIYYENMFSSNANFNLFLTYSLPSVKFKNPVISTIHDLIVLKTRCESKQFIKAHERDLNFTVRNSSLILTVSESSKTDICNYFNLSKEKVKIVHNGIEIQQFSREYSQEEIFNIQKKYNLPSKFILSFGGYRKHKNIERLLLAYSQLPYSIRKELKLVITNQNSDLIQFAKKCDIRKDVTFTPFIDEKDKVILYKMSLMVYCASLYEGFGVPIIEAQACHIPVITSNISSMPEAAGNSAIFVNPYEIKEIEEAIITLFHDQLLRERLIHNGYSNALKYTWEKSAKELHDILHNEWINTN